MKRFAIAALAVGLLCGAAAAQDAPDDVMEAYRAYNAAFDAGDIEAAAEAARTALAAGQAALETNPPQIDPVTLAALAENLGAAETALGRYDAASEAYARAAALLEEGAPVDAARNHRQAAETAYLDGDSGAALRLLDVAETSLERSLEGVERNVEIVRASGLEARIRFERGDLRRSGRAGREAAEAALRLPGPVPFAAALPAFYAGAYEAFSGETADAAFFLTIASRLYSAEPDADESMTTTLALWSRHVRRELDETDASAVFARLAALELPPAVAEDRDETAPDGFVPAEPSRRRPPEYPRDAAAGRIGDTEGIEGVSLVRFTVTEEGRVRDVEVVASLPISQFGEASARAVRSWRYEPATQDGVPVEDEVTVQFEFELAN